MTTTSGTTPNALDFSQYAQLRAGAKAHEAGNIQAVAKQFESLFTQMMLKSMRATKFGDDLTGEQGDIYKDMLDQQLATSLSSGRGIGLADMLVRQLGGTPKAANSVNADAAQTTLSGDASGGESLNLDLSSVNSLIPSSTSNDAGHDLLGSFLGHHLINSVSQMPASMARPGQSAAVASAYQSNSANSAESGNSGLSDQAQKFIAQLLPHAQKAAAQLGVSVQALVAQAALETGWGQHIGRDAQGRSSFNLFGIKASGDQPSINQLTTEYQNGQAHQERDDFRAYHSIADSFDDYVHLLKTSPRYAQVLKAGHNIGEFAKGLQNAGYATDPDYASKLLRVASRLTQLGSSGSAIATVGGGAG